MRIYTYKFSKKLNSTAQPVAGSEYDTYLNAVFLDNTDILNPSIRIVDSDGALDPTAANYARIFDPGNIDIDRYYFINTWRWTNEGWIAEMTVDVLATYKTAIGNSNQYIIRSSHSYDGNIIDNFYQTRTNVTTDRIAPSTVPWLQAVDAGCYIIGVVSPDPQFGSISYYVIDSSSLRILCAYLTDQSQTITTANGFNAGDASLALQNSLVDPFQYIKSCIYVPLPYASVTGDTNFTTLKIWSFGVPNCPGKTLSQQHPQYTATRQITLSKHPQTAARGNWVNTSPFTKAELSFPPFGTMDLDVSITATRPVIDMDYRTDLITGLTTLWIYAKETVNSADRVLIGSREAQIGIPVQLSQVSRDYVGGISNAVGGIASFIGGLFTGNAAGVAGGIAGMIGGAAGLAIPHTQSQGSSGAWYQLIAPCACYMTFFPIIEDDNDRFGRPLAGKGRVSDYPGYLICQNVNFPITNILATEYKMVKEEMESGFFYE